MISNGLLLFFCLAHCVFFALFISPTSILYRRTVNDQQENLRRILMSSRWRQTTGLRTLDFGPYHTVMMSATNLIQPELWFYNLDKQGGEIRDIREKKHPEYTFNFDFQLQRLKLKHVSTSVNGDMTFYRGVNAPTSYYGWYMNENADRLVVIVNKYRAAVFSLGTSNKSPSRVYGHWIAMDQSTNFNFLNNFVYGNETFVLL